MNEDEKALLSSFGENMVHSVKEGEICLYREGIIKATVKVLEKKVDDEYIKLKIEVLEAKYLKVGQVLNVDVKIGYENIMGIWKLMPLHESN